MPPPLSCWQPLLTRNALIAPGGSGLALGVGCGALSGRYGARRHPARVHHAAGRWLASRLVADLRTSGGSQRNGRWGAMAGKAGQEGEQLGWDTPTELYLLPPVCPGLAHSASARS